MILKTERLILRRWEESDAEDLYKYAKDPDVGPVAGWPAHKSAEESLSVIKNVFSGKEAYAVCLKEDGKAIGAIELMLNGHNHISQKDDECELGYWIGKPFWGLGLIPEAAREMLRHAFEDIGINKVWCGYYDGNTKSKRVQEKIGFRYRFTNENADVPLMHEKRTEHISCITKKEWLKKPLVLYVRGKGGSAEESRHYAPLFPDCDVSGFDYKSDTPWEAKDEFQSYIQQLKANDKDIILIANSIGAYFCMNAGIDNLIKKAFFISPIVDMEKLILDMMLRANVTEKELESKGNIQTDSGGDLSWDYLCYVRKNPLKWDAPTEVLYGRKDNLTSFETINNFISEHNARLTVMENGEHWFHTKEQMLFLDNWIEERTGENR